MRIVQVILVVYATHCIAAFSTVPARPEVATNSLTEFHEWADSRDIYRAVAVQDAPQAGGGRGLVALQDLGPGEVAARVPLSALIRLSPTSDVCDGNGYKSNIENDDNWAGELTAKLCQQDSLGDASPFREYMHIGLPNDAPRTVCRWSSSERLALQDAALVNESFENAAWRRRQLTNYRQGQHNNKAPVSSKKFLHYLDLVCSRTLKGRDGSRNLVPLIDNANHAPSEAGGGSFVVDSDSISLLVGNRGAKAGQAVTLDYGGRRSEDYLLHYGFVPDRCPSDSIIVPLGGENEEENDEFKLRWNDCTSFGGHSDVTVRSACSALLGSYETSLGEDVELLRNVGSIAKSAQNEDALRSVLNYRIAKKSLLSQAAGVRASGSSFMSVI